MPISSVLVQPIANSINAAYRPIVFRVTASRTGNPVPPVVYCDIYLNDIYYKTISKTQYNLKTVSNSEWEFDIQDAIQEFCKKFIEDNGQDSILEIPLVSVKVFCRFRASEIDLDGFIVPDGTVPIQGTVDTNPVPGTGTESHSFYGVNVTLQHEDNQDLALHLNSYKNRVWAGTTYPLSHRPDHYCLCTGDSDSFAILSEVEPAKLSLAYITKNNVSGEVNGDLPCIAVGIVGSPNLPAATNTVAYSYAINLSGTAPYTLSIISKPAWMTIAIVGNQITFTGTPIAQDTRILYPVTFTLSNCGGVPLEQDFNLVIFDNITCVPPTLIGAGVLPAANVGINYSHILNIDGTGPFTFTTNSRPFWLNIVIVGNEIRLTGIPSNAAVNNSQIVDINISNGCGSLHLTRIFMVYGNSTSVMIMNVSRGPITLVDSNGSYDFAFDAGLLPVDITNRLITIAVMTGASDVLSYNSATAVLTMVRAHAVQGDVFSAPSDSTYLTFNAV